MDTEVLQLENLLRVLDYIGVSVFSLSGALLASRLKLDIGAFAFFGFFTGVGGGTLRDLLLGTEVFWIADPVFLVLSLTVGALTWFMASYLEKMNKPLLWADAIGLAVYCVVGAAKALSFGHGIAVALLMGVVTATFGGIIRDTIANQPPVLLRNDIYITAAFMGALLFTMTQYFGVPYWTAAIIGTGGAFILRGLAIQYKLALPRYSK